MAIFIFIYNNIQVLPSVRPHGWNQLSYPSTRIHQRGSHNPRNSQEQEEEVGSFFALYPRQGNFLFVEEQASPAPLKTQPQRSSRTPAKPIRGVFEWMYGQPLKNRRHASLYSRASLKCTAGEILGRTFHCPICKQQRRPRPIRVHTSIESPLKFIESYWGKRWTDWEIKRRNERSIAQIQTHANETPQ